MYYCQFCFILCVDKTNVVVFLISEGNALALTALEELVDNDLQQRGISPKRSIIVFNGDFNWFNGVRRESFVSFNQRIMSMVQENKAICIAGNIEAELGASNRLSGSEESRSGCGCAYPDYVSDYVVSNSDQIMSNFVKLTSESTTRNDQEVFKNFIFIDTNLV